MSNVITLDELARELGVTRRHAARKCRLLAEHQNFPRPLPGLGNRFSRALVEAWFSNGGHVAPDPVPQAGPAHDFVAAARASLEARYVHG